MGSTVKEAIGVATIVDTVTGEQFQKDIYNTMTVAGDDFWQAYSGGFRYLAGIRPDYCLRVLYVLLGYAEKGRVHINGAVRDDIMEVCGIKATSVRCAVAALVSNGVLIRERRGDYSINPAFFWNGRFMDRARMLGSARGNVHINMKPNEKLVGVKYFERTINREYEDDKE